MRFPAVKLGLLGVIIAILALGYVVKSCQRPSDPSEKIPPATQRTIDSLTRTKPAFDSVADSLRVRIIHDTVQSVQLQEAAARSATRARDAQARADALAEAAHVAQDSTAAWRRAYEARTAEAVALRETVRNDSLAIGREVDARRALALAYGADTLRRVAIERVNADLSAVIERLDVPCRIVGPIPCPSRTTTAVLSAIGGAVAGRKL
jgi:hypothetical protein